VYDGTLTGYEYQLNFLAFGLEILRCNAIEQIPSSLQIGHPAGGLQANLFQAGSIYQSTTPKNQDLFPMTNTTPSLLSPDNTAQAARNTPPPLPPPQPGEPTRQSEQQQLFAANLHHDDEDAGAFMVVTHPGSVRPTILDQTLAVHTQTAREAMQSTTTPATNIGVTLVGTHVTPTCPTLPPEVAPQAALLANN
jgi:hypothetical protein